MKSNTIVLVLIIALAAFGLGFALNTPTVNEDVSYPALLNARLLETTSVDGADTQTTSIKDKLEQRIQIISSQWSIKMGTSTLVDMPNNTEEPLSQN